MPKSFVSIGLGCDVKYAKDLIYSEGMDIENKKLIIISNSSKRKMSSIKKGHKFMAFLYF